MYLEDLSSYKEALEYILVNYKHVNIFTLNAEIEKNIYKRPRSRATSFKDKVLENLSRKFDLDPTDTNFTISFVRKEHIKSKLSVKIWLSNYNYKKLVGSLTFVGINYFDEYTVDIGCLAICIKDFCEYVAA